MSRIKGFKIIHQGGILKKLCWKYLQALEVIKK